MWVVFVCFLLIILADVHVSDQPSLSDRKFAPFVILVSSDGSTRGTEKAVERTGGGGASTADGHVSARRVSGSLGACNSHAVLRCRPSLPTCSSSRGALRSPLEAQTSARARSFPR